MLKWGAKLRPLLVSGAEGSRSGRRLLRRPVSTTPISHLASYLPSRPAAAFQLLHRSPSFSPFMMIQKRDASSKERKRTRGTPVTSKLKKTKIKSYSSYKSRFRTMNDGQIRRWREGKRHNAHLKSKKAKRRLRQPALVHAAYAKVMKKLNFCG